MRLTPSVGLFVASLALLLGACVDDRIRPDLVQLTDATANGDAAASPDEVGVLPTPQPSSTDNAYVCSCVVQLPIACARDWCGLPTTGTSVTGDGMCDLGFRDLTVCDPMPLSSRPTYAALAADCAGRVQDIVGRGARAINWWCDPCAVRFGCSAVRRDGTVRTSHEDACTGTCGRVALQPNAHGDWNPQEATYVPAEVQPECGDGYAETPTLCHPPGQGL